MNSQEKQVFDGALSDLQSTANYFSITCIKESRVRMQYFTDINAMSAEIKSAIQEGKLTVPEASELANKLRNQIMDLARKKSSQVGRAYAMRIKSHGLSMYALQEKYSKEIYGKNFYLLTEQEQSSVYTRIIKSSGHANPNVMESANKIGKVGRRILFVSLAISVYEVYEAEDKSKEIVHQGILTSAAMAGGWATGGAVVGMGVCAATAPICIGAFALIGGFVAAYAADAKFGSIYQSLGW